MNIHVVSNCCPVGCGSEVVLLKPDLDEPIFCYCYACGCSWGKPEHAQWQAEPHYVKGPNEFCASAARLPSTEEIKIQGLSSSVIETIDISEYHPDILEVVNEEISKHK